MLMRAATVVQVLQDLFYVLLHVLFYLWSLLNTDTITRLVTFTLRVRTSPRPSASNLEQAANPLCAQANSASYPRRDEKWLAHGLRGESLMCWLEAWGGGMSVCCTAGLRVSPSRAINGRIMRHGIISSCQSSATSEIHATAYQYRRLVNETETAQELIIYGWPGTWSTFLTNGVVLVFCKWRQWGWGMGRGWAPDFFIFTCDSML